MEQEEQHQSIPENDIHVTDFEVTQSLRSLHNIAPIRPSSDQHIQIQIPANDPFKDSPSNSPSNSSSNAEPHPPYDITGKLQSIPILLANEPSQPLKLSQPLKPTNSLHSIKYPNQNDQHHRYLHAHRSIDFGKYGSQATIATFDEAPNVNTVNLSSSYTWLRRFAHCVLTKGADNGDNRQPTKIIPPPQLTQKTYRANTKSIWGAVNLGDLGRVKDIVSRHGDSYKRMHNGQHILDQRGPEGELLLHLAVLLRHDDIVDYLLKERLPENADYINAVYEGYDYYGEHCCHIIAVQGRLGMLKKFIELGADVHTPRAVGKFFRQNGTLYFGGTILAFAACMGHFDIVKYLINHVGIDPRMKDHYGNNVLHVLAYWGYYNDTRARHPNREEYKHNGKHTQLGGLYKFLTEVGDDRAANYAGMTPLLVAVERGNTEMVNAILNHKREMLWVYGKSSSYLYDLSEIDTYVDPYVMNHAKGGLEIAIRQKHMSIVSLPLFQRLLEAKWLAYGQRMFYFNFIGSLAYMVVFTATIWLLPNGADYYYIVKENDRNFVHESRLDYFSSATGNARLVLELILVLSNLATVFEEFGDLWGNFRLYFSGSGKTENIIQWTNIGLFTLVIVLRLFHLTLAENVVLGLHAIAGWLYLLYFAKGFKGIGTLSLIFFKILETDLLRFLTLIGVFILGFGEALWLQMRPFAAYYEYNMSHPSNSTTTTTLVPGYNDWTFLPTGLVWTYRVLNQQGVYETERQWRMVWAELIMKFDEKILTDHNRNRLEKINGPMPVSRIGFPTRTFTVDERKRYNYRRQREAQKQNLKSSTFSVRGFLQGKHSDDEDEEIFFTFSTIMEFRDDLELPTRMIASSDATSPLSGHTTLPNDPWDPTIHRRDTDVPKPVIKSPYNNYMNPDTEEAATSPPVNSEVTDAYSGNQPPADGGIADEGQVEHLMRDIAEERPGHDQNIRSYRPTFANQHEVEHVMPSFRAGVISRAIRPPINQESYHDEEENSRAIPRNTNQTHSSPTDGVYRQSNPHQQNTNTGVSPTYRRPNMDHGNENEYGHENNHEHQSFDYGHQNVEYTNIPSPTLYDASSTHQSPPNFHHFGAHLPPIATSSEDVYLPTTHIEPETATTVNIPEESTGVPIHGNRPKKVRHKSPPVGSKETIASNDEAHPMHKITAKGDKPPLWMSIWLGLSTIVSFFMTRGADIGADSSEQTTMELIPPEILQKELLEDVRRIWAAVRNGKGDLKRLKEIVERHGESYQRLHNGQHILEQRGPEGETLLHLAVLFRHDDIVDYLLKERLHENPNYIYEGSNYYGEHCCHILAEQGRLGMLKKFVNRGADVHTPRATGKFFSQNGTLYFGGTILAFAACMGHMDIVKYLINTVGVDPGMRDHYGNNVLHVLAYWGYYNDTRARHPKREEYKNSSKYTKIGGIYEYLIKIADDTTANERGMTPLHVAVDRGNTEMVDAILTHRRETLWVYGRSASYMYDLTEIDTYVDPYIMNHVRSALEIAIKRK
ncbi:Transient receptor putative cation channel sub V member 5, partial [Blyttiomyces sp. JEL0837]